MAGMWQEVKKILRHSSVYGIAVLMTNIMGVILLPLYLNYLSPDQLGLLEIINRTSDIMRIILMVGLVTTTLRFYQDQDDQGYKNSVISTAMLFLAAFAFVILGTVSLFAGSMSELMLNSSEHVNYVYILCALLFLEVLYIVPILYFQARLMSFVFIIISITRFILGVFLIVYFVAYKNMGVMGVLIGQLIQVGLMATVLYIWTLLKVGFRIDKILLRKMLKFGLPFVPGSLFLFILNSGDRYVLLHLTSTTAVGIYAIGYRIGSLTTALIMSPFMRVWSALYVQYSKRPDKDYLFANFLTYVILVFTFASLGVIFFRQELLAVLGDAVYWEAAKIVPFIVLAYLFWAASLILDSGFYITKKTYYKPILFGISAAIAVGLCFLLIPKLNYFGAVYATVVSYAVYFFLSLMFLRKILLISYQWMRMFKIIVVAVAVLFVNEFLIGDRSLMAMITISWREWYFYIGIKVMLLILFPFLLLLLKFYNSEELTKFNELKRS